MRDVLITKLAEFLYFQNLKISRSIEILEIWKYANLKTVEILTSKIMCF